MGLEMRIALVRQTKGASFTFLTGSYATFQGKKLNGGLMDEGDRATGILDHFSRAAVGDSSSNG